MNRRGRGRAWALAADGIFINIRLTPKGGRDAIEGVDMLADGRAVVKARVRAAPSEGEANTALIRLLSRALKVAPRDVNLIAGATARLKRVKITGDGAALAAALEKIITAAGSMA